MFSLALTRRQLALIQFRDVDVVVMWAASPPLLRLSILRDPKAPVIRISSLELVVHDYELPLPPMVVFLTHEDANAADEVEDEAADEDWESEFPEHLCKKGFF